MKSKQQPGIARVIANYGAELVLVDESGNCFTAIAQKKLGLIVCGDLVTYQTPDSASRNQHSRDANREDQKLDLKRVTAVQVRSGTLARTDRRGRAKAIAANVSQLVVVTAPKPPFDPLLIDRYTVAANHIGADMLLVINKMDLLAAQSGEQADSMEKLYGDIGYPVIRCSTETDKGLDDLALALRDQVSILVGQSGVGKSSLLNKLLPETQTRTGALSEISGLGRHTTTVTTWFDLPSGGAIIDSAGVRLFALDHLTDIDIQAGFREISDLAANCKFNDCKHVHEPECAVLEALHCETLSAQRYEHFLSLQLKHIDR